MDIKKVSLISVFLASSLVIGCSFLIYEAYKCSKDNSKLLKKIGIPMQENVLSFYKENQRYPNLNESTELMEKLGCKNSTQIEHWVTKNQKGGIYTRSSSYNCEYGSKTLGYGVSIGDLKVRHDAEKYGFGLSKRNTHCSPDFTNDGRSRNFSCQQHSCFLKNWSH